MKAKTAFTILRLLERLDDNEARLVFAFIRGMLMEKTKK